MKIQNSYSPSFGMKRLYKATLNSPTLLDKNAKCDVYISELEKSDKLLMERNLRKYEKSEIGKKVIKNFLDECDEENSKIGIDKRFFVVERPRLFGKSQIKAIGLAELINSHHIYVSYLQSDSKLKDKRPMKGAGSCILYAIVDLARKLNKESVGLNSDAAAVEFYHKAKFVRPWFYSTYFVLPQTQKYTEPFFENMQKKYSIKNEI